MLRHLLTLAVPLLALPGALAAQQDPAARALVARALDHMGGEGVARAVRTLQYNAVTAQLAPGQEAAAGDPMPLNVRSQVVRLDFERARLAVTADLPFNGPGGSTLRLRQVAVPGGAMQENGANVFPAPAPPAAGAPQVRLFPHRLLLTAIDPATRLELAARRRGTAGQGVRMTTAIDTLTIWFNTEGRLAFSEILADDPILGDRITRTSYHNWALVGRDGLRLPQRLDITTNGRTTLMNSYNGMTPNVDLADSLFHIADSILPRSRALVGGGAIVVRLDSLAPGVYHVAGGSHASLAVVQGDSIVLFEVPLSTQRVRAILDTLARRFPRTPVRLAVATHDHWDHAGGVRAALAARLPLIGHRNNVDAFRAMASARRTLVPDGVERLRHDIRSMDDSLTIGSGANRLVIHHIATAHDDGMLVAYVPDARIMFLADMVPSPNANTNREVASLVQARGLDIQTVVPAHGTPIPYSQVTQAIR